MLSNLLLVRSPTELSIQHAGLLMSSTGEQLLSYSSWHQYFWYRWGCYWSSWPPGHILFHIQPAVNHHPKVFLLQAALQPSQLSIPKPPRTLTLIVYPQIAWGCQRTLLSALCSTYPSHTMGLCLGWQGDVFSLGHLPFLFALLCGAARLLQIPRKFQAWETAVSVWSALVVNLSHFSASRGCFKHSEKTK